MSNPYENYVVEEMETSFRPSLDPNYEPQYEATFDARDQARVLFNQVYDESDNKYKLNESSTALVRYAPDFRTDPFYHKVLQHMQRGEWQQSVLLLKAVTEKYPSAIELEWLMQDAMMRAEIEQAWGTKITDSSSSTPQILRWVMRSLAVLFVVLLVGAGGWYYVQLKQSNEAAAERLSLLTQAQSAMADAKYQDAVALFEQLLVKDPENAQALTGKEEATKQIGFADAYQKAVEAMNANNQASALVTLKSLNQKAPGYKDVANLIKQLESVISIDNLYQNANNAYQAEKWEDAIQLYEDVRKRDNNFNAKTIVERLVTAYNKVALQIISSRPAENDDLSKPVDYFRKVLRLKTTDEVAQLESDLLDRYRTAVSATSQQNHEAARLHYEHVYKTRPNYLGGLLLEQLYDTYLVLGDQSMQTEEYSKAIELYRTAMGLPVADKSQAIKMVTKASIAMQPTATPTSSPTPTPEPTATPVPPQAQTGGFAQSRSSAFAVSAAPVNPGPPPARPITEFTGWIMFEREGSYYVMRPDGSSQQPVAADATKYQALYELRQWSPDGTTKVYVTESPGGDDKADIWKLRADLPENWNRRFLLNDYPKFQYDPAWSPTNSSITFVSNHTGGDEIWVMDTDGANPRQLTHNGWEWDKHPTWTADGSKIIFFSNRSGRSQIWAMNSDGSGQINISNSNSNDVNPVLVR